MIARLFRWSVHLRPLLGAITCLWAIGCGESPPPPMPNIPAAPVGDEQVLLTLDCFEPMYQVDANRHVIKLRITMRQLSDPVLAEVGKLTELRNIDFYGVLLTDDGLAHLKDLKELRSLGLGGTTITDRGLVHLEKLPSLQWLWLPKNTVTPAALQKLKEARPDMNIYPQ